MRPNKTFVIFLGYLLVSIHARAQTPIFTEKFENCGAAYSEYGVHSDGGSDYFLRTNGTDETINCVAPTNAGDGFTSTSGLLAFTNTDGFYYTGEDTDRSENPNQSGGAFGSGANSGGVHFNNIDVSGYTDVQIKCSFAARNDSPTVGTFEFGDGIKIYVDKTNNGTYELLAEFGIVETPTQAGNQYLSLDTDSDGFGEGSILTNAFQEFTFDVTGATNMDVRIELVSTGSNEEIAFDTFVVQGTAAASLSSGDIVFTGYNSRDTDDIAFMATTDIAGGTEIRFTDRGWTSGETFRTGDGAEGEILYTVADGGLSAGDQVVIAVSTPSVTSGTGAVSAVSSTMSFSTIGDQVLAFIGTAGSPSTFIAGIQMNSGTWDANATTNATSTLPNDLVSGSTGFVISPEINAARYNCTVTSGTAEAIKTAVFNQANWTTDDNNHLDLPCSVSSAPSSVTVAVTAFLEGAWNGTDMNTALEDADLVAASDPYNGINSHTATASVANAAAVPDGVVDWVLVELREAGSAAAANDATRVGSAAGFLKSDGSIVDTGGSSNLSISLSGNSGSSFYVVVYHRNHLPIMSLAAVSESGGVYTIDLSASANVYEAGNAVSTLSGSSKVGMHAGDLDQDGDIDATDLSTWRSSNGATYSYGASGKADFNLDGVINAVDRNDFHQKNKSKTRQVPSS